MYNVYMKHRLNYYVTDRQYHQLQKLKIFTDISMSQHIRLALDLYLKRVFKQLKIKNGEVSDG